METFTPALYSVANIDCNHGNSVLFRVGVIVLTPHMLTVLVE